MRFLAVFVLSVFLLASCASEKGSETDIKAGDKKETSSAENPDSGNVETSEDVDVSADVDEEEDLTPKSKDAKASREEIEAKDAPMKGLGPTDTIRAFNDAIIQKDAAKIKSFLSRASLKSVQQNAKRIGKTVDEILTTDNAAPMPAEREMQNEKVDGNKATVEVKNTVLGSFDNFHLVKEDGNWRVDLVKMEKEAIEKLNNLQKDAPKIQ